MDSEPGDYIGGGDNYYYTPAEGAFSSSQNYDNGVRFGFANGSHNWSLDFAAPDSALLKVQIYDNRASACRRSRSSHLGDAAGRGLHCDYPRQGRSDWSRFGGSLSFALSA